MTDYQEKLADYLKNASSEFTENVPEDFFNGAKAEFSHDQLVFNLMHVYSVIVEIMKKAKMAAHFLTGSFYRASTNYVGWKK